MKSLFKYAIKEGHILIRIDKNESPIAPLSQVQLNEILKDMQYNLYPDEEYQRFREAYASFYKLKPNQVIAANGSDELIQKLMLIMPEGPVLTLNPDFFMYQAYAAQIQRPIEFVESDQDLQFNLQHILDRIEAVRPSFFIMSNPHNPTGKQFDMTFINSISEKLNKIGSYFVIDEAYLDYGQPYEVPNTPHVIRMRTLSKAFGIAGLRLGVIIGHEATIRLIQRIEHPYPLNSFTLKVATSLFISENDTTAFLKRQRTLATQLKAIFTKHVVDVIKVYPSYTNFVLTKGKLAHDLGEFIFKNGFKPRIYEEENMKDYVRYSIATEEQLEQLEGIVKEWRERYDLSKNT